MTIHTIMELVENDSIPTGERNFTSPMMFHGWYVLVYSEEADALSDVWLVGTTGDVLLTKWSDTLLLKVDLRDNNLRGAIIHRFISEYQEGMDSPGSLLKQIIELEAL